MIPCLVKRGEISKKYHNGEFIDDAPSILKTLSVRGVRLAFLVGMCLFASFCTTVEATIRLHMYQPKAAALVVDAL